MNNTIGKLCELALVLILAGSLAPPQATQPTPGTLKWRFDTRVSITSSAAIDANGTIYVGSRDFYAFHPDGTLKWQYPIETGQPPVIGADGTIYVTAPHNLHAFHPNGALKWSSSFGIPWAAPALGADGTIYLGSMTGDLYAINPDGAVKWRFRQTASVLSSPAIGADGTIYFGSDDGTFYALNPDSTLKWHFTTGISVRSSPTIGADGTIYFGSRDGYLYALTPDGTLKWRFKTEDSVDSSPTIGADGTIYFGSRDGYFYALYSSSPGLANTPWPIFRHDHQRTGRASMPSR